MPADDMIDVTVWMLLDSEGRAVADCNPDQLRDEYHCDIGDLDPRSAFQLFQLTVRVPRPRPVPVACVVPTAVLAVG
jgi:hypothetical protein